MQQDQSTTQDGGRKAVQPNKMVCSKPRQEKETHTSPKAAWTAADLTLTATTGLSADTAVSNGSRFAFS
jgi:hypothetical protein